MQRVSPFSTAEESLRMSSPGGMARTAAPMGPNMFDSGPASKVAVGTQDYNNDRMTEQSILQNTKSASSQAGANAVQQMRKQELVSNNAEYKANQLFEQRRTEMMSVMNTPATLAMGNMSPPEMDQFRSDIATGKAMQMGVNPDLVQNQMSEQRYG